MPKRAWHPKKRARFLGRLMRRDGFLCLLCLQPLRFPFPTGFRAADESQLQPEIDHVNNDPKVNRLEELCLLCEGCNVSERNRRQTGSPRALNLQNLKEYTTIARSRASAIAGVVFPIEPAHAPTDPDGPPQVTKANASGCEREIPTDLTNRDDREVVFERQAPMARRLVDRGEVDAAAEESQILESLMNPLFRLWLFVELHKRGELSRDDIIDAGGEYLTDKLGRGVQMTVGRYFRSCSNGINGWVQECLSEGHKAVWRLKAGDNRLKRYTVSYGRVLALSVLLRRPTPWLQELALDETTLTMETTAHVRERQ